MCEPRKHSAVTQHNAQGGDFDNALQAALVVGYVRVAEVLTDRSADVNAQGGHYGNALHVTSLKGHEKVVEMLTEQGRACHQE